MPHSGLRGPAPTRVISSGLGIYLGRNPGPWAVWRRGVRGPGTREEIKMFSPRKQTPREISKFIRVIALTAESYVAGSLSHHQSLRIDSIRVPGLQMRNLRHRRIQLPTITQPVNGKAGTQSVQPPSRAHMVGCISFIVGHHLKGCESLCYL